MKMFAQSLSVAVLAERQNSILHNDKLNDFIDELWA